MNILFLSSGARVPSARFRILPYLKHFRAEGHRCTLAHSFPQKYDYFPWMGFRPSQLLKRSVRWWHWFRARLQHYDVVLIDREIFDAEDTRMEQRFRDCCGKLVIDLDDAVFLRYPEKFEHLMHMADLAVCGNRFLMQKVQKTASDLPLAHVPTCVDLDDYEPRSLTQPVKQPVVGWMGTAGNLKYLAVAAEALRIVSGRQKFVLKVVVPDCSGLADIDLAGVNVVHEPWDPVNEVRQLQSLDIGLMPLFPDQQWDIYKCGLKLIQYLAVEVPGIAAPVGVNSEILDQDQNGLTAQTTDEWVKALETLLQDPDKRVSMGKRGRQTVADRYSIQANYPILRDALVSLVSPE